MTTISPDIDTLAAEPTGPVTLEDGSQVEIERLRTRQLFKLLKILTRGAQPILADLDWSGQTDQQEFGQQLLAALLVSIPEAEDEALEFIRAMVRPVGFIERPRSQEERNENFRKQDDLSWALNNPPLEDTVEIISRVVQKEAPEILALGKKLGSLLNNQRATLPNRTASSPNDSVS